MNEYKTMTLKEILSKELWKKKNKEVLKRLQDK
ncbi:MAG: hypothetical protein ACD_3C00083G0003 [uncultured bacterium (gcode 4)]|uniref:Uncharacterized protein n=1 Tax=uncultured bacterium (gcode 4) TaxID=1234023 RepID=K2GDE7_9BACT|nr:MAG: hypothetical protein ACD_3C00083G0003 [uncultured bacterium (gcode 4)]